MNSNLKNMRRIRSLTLTIELWQGDSDEIDPGPDGLSPRPCTMERHVVKTDMTTEFPGHVGFEVVRDAKVFAQGIDTFRRMADHAGAEGDRVDRQLAGNLIP